MSCLNITTKIAMMMDSLQTAKGMLSDDSIRPNTKVRLQAEIEIWRRDIKELYIDLFKVIRN